MTWRRLLAGIGLWTSVVAIAPARADEPKPLDLGTVEGSEKFPGTHADRERLRHHMIEHFRRNPAERKFSRQWPEKGGGDK